MVTRKSFDGTELFVEVTGEGIPIVLSPGFCTTLENFRPQVAPLVEAGYRVVLWDYRGQGRSQAPSQADAYSMDHLVHDLACVLDWTAPGEAAVMAGLSLGGLVSLHFAVRFPERVRALVLSSTGPGFKREENRQRWIRVMERTASKIEDVGLDRYLQGDSEVMAVGGDMNTKAARRARAAIVAQDPAAVAALARNVAGPSEAVIDELPKITAPTLVLLGERDAPYRAPSEILASRIPKARLVVLPEAGHICNLDAMEDFNRELLDFLQENASPGVS